MITLTSFKRLLADDSAQVLPFIALLVVLFLGASGLCLDLGRAYVVQRELQASTDAAALAAAYELSVPNATTAAVTTKAKAYSSFSSTANGVTTSGTNLSAALPNVTFAISFECLTTLTKQNILCTASSTGSNAVQITQTSTISTFFIQVLNLFKSKPMTSLKVSTTATAAMKGAPNAQYNVALVVDTTASMAQPDKDASCNSTRIACALSGVQTLLQSLTPCTVPGASSCSGFDNVSIFTYPAVEADTANNDYTCPASSKKGSQSSPAIMAYPTPQPGATWSAPTGKSPTYQITGFQNDYSSTNQAGGALNTSSFLSIAAGGSGQSNCPGMQAIGGQGTYFAGAIYAALSALNAEQAANPGSKNALVILSDGDASTTSMKASNNETLTLTGLYPSLLDQCHQAITAAQSASASTTVYSIAYGASSSGCITDIPSISPCQTMQQMASSPQDFFSDATASQNKGQCTSSSNPNLSLTGIFTTLATTFTHARLIPNGTT